MPTDATAPGSKHRHASPPSVKRPRARKLQPLVAPCESPPPKIDPFSHVRTEVERLQPLMAAAVAARDLHQVEAIMAQLLTLAERSDASNAGTRDLLAYLDACEADLRALVQQEERERKHQRFVANEFMRQAVRQWHTEAPSVIERLLHQAEAAYRRARDKRAECIGAIRYRVEAEAQWAEATRRFDAGDITGAMDNARAASDAFAAFRASPSYHKSQLLLSLSEASDAWDETPMRDWNHDDLERCVGDMEGFFQERARAATKLLFAESKRCADAQQLADARAAMARCRALYQWLSEPLPAAASKWTRQLARLEISRALQSLQSPRETAAQLLAWATECKAGELQRDDLVERGVVRFALEFATTVDGPDAAAAVFQLLDSVEFLDAGDEALGLLRQTTDLKTAFLALLRLADVLAAAPQRVRVVCVLATALDSKASTHVAIHKCDLLTCWTRLREANSATPDVLAALVTVVHRLLAPSFPGIAGADAIRSVVAIFSRHWKHIGVATACANVFAMLCTSRDVGVSALAPSTTGFPNAVVSALRHYAEESPAQARDVIGTLARVVQKLCEMDAAFTKAIEAAGIPALVAALGKTPAAWHLPLDLVEWLSPRHLSRIDRDCSAVVAAPRQLPRATSTVDVQRVCVATFGLRLHMRQYSIVRFLVPDDATPAPAVDQCCLQVTRLERRVATHVFAFPSNGLYSLAMLRRELTGPADARAAFCRTLIASMPPPLLVRGATSKKRHGS